MFNWSSKGTLQQVHKGRICPWPDTVQPCITRWSYDGSSESRCWWRHTHSMICCSRIETGYTQGVVRQQVGRSALPSWPFMSVSTVWQVPLQWLLHWFWWFLGFRYIWFSTVRCLLITIMLVCWWNLWRLRFCQFSANFLYWRES